MACPLPNPGAHKRMGQDPLLRICRCDFSDTQATTRWLGILTVEIWVWPSSPAAWSLRMEPSGSRATWASASMSTGAIAITPTCPCCLCSGSSKKRIRRISSLQSIQSLIASNSPHCFENAHGVPVVTCAGGTGGVAQGTPAKSKNSCMSGMARSRCVRFGRFQRVSMNFRYAV